MASSAELAVLSGSDLPSSPDVAMHPDTARGIVRMKVATRFVKELISVFSP
ncbi:MAG: hypothetical protein QM820_22065 [Minicystis sp.]